MLKLSILPNSMKDVLTPKDLAAAVSSEAIKDALRRNAVVQRVHLVFYSEPDAGIFLENHAF